MYRRSLLRSFSGCVVYVFRTDAFASVWTLTFCISRNSPLKTNLPALEWHATSACEPFCSSFWNRMSKPLQFLSFSLPWTLHLGSVYLGSWMNPSSLKAVSTRCCTIVVHSEAPWTCQTLQLGKRFANRCAGWLLPPSSKRCPSCSTMAFLAERLLEGSPGWSGITRQEKEWCTGVQGLAFHFTHMMSCLQLKLFLSIHQWQCFNLIYFW